MADRVDGGGGSPEDRALRSKVLTFCADHAPVLLTNANSPEAGTFRGSPGQGSATARTPFRHGGSASSDPR